ncbi:MAG TPA: CoA transferase [Blastocatellia bacterium]|nr:CoA transferase [Blastocatellia bacterium]
MNPASEGQTKTTGPLAGVKILDFCSFINGAYSAALMGDLGADVVKIEPLTGDNARSWGPFLKGESRFYQAWNRNKRCIAVDLTSKDGREIVAELARGADVVIENFRRGVTERLGIDYRSLREINPRIIYCSSTAFGTRGVYRDRPGYDPVLQALSGVASDNARYSGSVAISAVAASDYQASMLIVAGALSALYHREKSGQGQRIETSLLQGIMSIQSHYFVEALECDEEGALGIYPYRFFETRDDLIFIAAGTDKFWMMLCEVLGVKELGTDPRYAANGQRVGRRNDLNSVLEPLFRLRTSADWEMLLVEKGVPCGGVKDYLAFLNDPQVSAMEMNPVVEHPLIGPMRMAGVPIDLEATPGGIQRAAPTLGQHTEEILGELGFDAQRIARLRADLVIS